MRHKAFGGWGTHAEKLLLIVLVCSASEEEVPAKLVSLKESRSTDEYAKKPRLALRVWGPGVKSLEDSGNNYPRI